MKMNGKTVFVGFVNIVYVGDATIERMTQSQVLILQHVPWERPGRILDSLDDLGLQYQIINVAKQKKPDLPDFGEVSGVVIMGGPMGALDYDKYPGLKAGQARAGCGQRWQAGVGRVPGTSDHRHRAGSEAEVGRCSGNRFCAD